LNNSENDIKSGLLGGPICDILQDLGSLGYKMSSSDSADEQALLSLDYFDKMENLLFL
jgi:hypothetical protein